ncbi:MAG TPA: type II toxin-antitoxin system HipA family toxin [Deferrisomatales bacterium]|nr:type II toxin-antitoxin system HipA family toxin [Deferrisomatales bacterium]
MTTVAEVKLWGRTIGAVALEEGGRAASFQFDPAFIPSGIEVSPLRMPLSREIYSFPGLAPATFHGLPGLLADSLPDRYGNTLIDTWLATQGRKPDSFNAVERLCYVGTRGMGALEFAPATGPKARRANPIEVERLVELASEILSHRNDLQATFGEAHEKEEALRDILRVGTSAGGARAKAVVAWSPETGEIRSGQVNAGPGFEHWLLKFDGVSGNRDKEMEDPKGYGVIEYAYSKMATDAGISMSACRLLEEHGRRHFMTRRFDRLPEGGKLHMQSLGGLAHFDYNMAGAHSYEQALLVIRQLGLPRDTLEEQFRRMVFNVVARNQDDHVKNIAFLMDKEGRWSLSPAFDVTYSYQPTGQWTSVHQMTLNGKRDRFVLDDLRTCAEQVAMKRGRAEAIYREVRDVVARWPDYADAMGVSPAWRDQIARNHRLDL